MPTLPSAGGMIQFPVSLHSAKFFLPSRAFYGQQKFCQRILDANTDD